MTTVHPDVWSDALRQAGGDASRIEVLSETSVVVHNRSDWRQHRRGPSPLHRVAPPTQQQAAPVESVKSAAPVEPVKSTAPVSPVRSVAPVTSVTEVPEVDDTPEEPAAGTPSPAPTSNSRVPQPTFLHSAPPTEELTTKPAKDDEDGDNAKAPVIPIAAFVAPQLRAADSDS